MRPELRRLLMSVDDPVHGECPADFSWQTAMEEVRRLVPIVEAIVSERCTLDDQVQDASFFADIACQRDGASASGRYLRGWLRVRFSSFGRLFTVWSVSEPGEDFPPEMIARVIDLVRAAGFVHVDAQELEVPYDGANPHVSGTWWIRFFDSL